MFDNQQTKKEFNLVSLFFVFLEIVFLIIAGVFITDLLRASDVIADDEADKQIQISVSNLQELVPELKQSDVKNIQDELAVYVQSNTNYIPLSSTASIRDGSLVSNSLKLSDSTLISGIIDNPDLEQSYRFYYQYFNDNSSTDDEDYYHSVNSFVCLNNGDEAFYPNFSCDSTYDSGILYFIMNQTIRSVETDEFNLFSGDDDVSLINIYIDENIALEDEPELLVKAKDVVRGFGLPSDIFNYEIIAPDDITYIINP